MGCPTWAEPNENLSLTVTTHNPTTGVATVADAAPGYRIYQDLNPIPVATGSLAALDAGNLTGAYGVTLALTSGNGYGPGKTYTAAVTATVGGVTANITFEFHLRLVADEGPGEGTVVVNLTTRTAGGSNIGSVPLYITSTDDANAPHVVDVISATDATVQVHLDPGTYYVWMNKAGYDFANPSTITVT